MSRSDALAPYAPAEMRSLTRPITSNRKFIDFPRPIGSFEKYCTELFIERGFDFRVALRLTRLRQLYQDELERGTIWDREA